MSGILTGVPQAFEGAKLFDLTLAADTASIDTGATLSQSYDLLEIYGIFRTTEAVVGSTVLFTFNGDTGANYDHQRVSGLSGTAGAGANVAQTSIPFAISGANANSGSAGPIWGSIPAYAQTTFHKAGIWTANVSDDTAADGNVAVRGWRWRSTAAINRITVTANSGSLVTGSRLLIYGR